MEKKLTVIRYIFYSIEILIFYVLQGTPNLPPEILGGRPVLLICLALAIAAFEKELPAMFFGLACGVMCDLGLGNTIGFFAVALTAVCFFEAQLFKSVMVKNFVNSMAVCFAGCVLIIGLYFLFFYILKGYGSIIYYFVNHYISRIIYTFLCCIPVYFINKLLFVQTERLYKGGDSGCQKKKIKRRKKRK